MAGERYANPPKLTIKWSPVKYMPFEPKRKGILVLQKNAICLAAYSANVQGPGHRCGEDLKI